MSNLFLYFIGAIIFYFVMCYYEIKDENKGKFIWSESLDCLLPNMFWILAMFWPLYVMIFIIEKGKEYLKSKNL